MDISKIKTSQDARAAGLPVFKVLSDSAIKAYKAEDGARKFEITASSDADDLVGDWFSQKALNKMGDTAPGMTMFLNHSYEVPEDVFGSVTEATVSKKSVLNRVLNKEVECWCLTYEGVVTEVNERAIKTHDLMMEGRVTLGASVSVLITDSKGQKDGTRQIDDVVNLECSIVGLPCNPTSWVTNASKALKMFAEGRAPESESARTVAPQLLVGEPVQAQLEKMDEGRIAKRAFGMMLVGLMAAKQRSQRGVSVLSELAKASKLDVAQVNEILNGVFDSLSDETLKAFSDVLGVPVMWPMAAPGEIASVNLKGIFEDEFTENTANIYFLTGTLEGAYYDLRRGVRAGTVSVEEIGSMLAEGLDEFKTKCVELLVPQLTQEFGQHESDYDPWGYWSASALEQANRIQKAGVSKAGARNSKDDMERLQKMHDLCVELGVACHTAGSSEPGTASGDADADVKSAPGADKAATLIDAIAQKDIEIADLKATLDLAVRKAEEAAAVAKKAAEETEDWKAVSRQALEKLEAFGLQPMPRASAASAGVARQ